jgi:hypothetical protein
MEAAGSSETRYLVTKLHAITSQKLSKLTQVISQLLVLWSCPLRISAGTPSILRCFVVFLSPSRKIHVYISG